MLAQLPLLLLMRALCFLLALLGLQRDLPDALLQEACALVRRRELPLQLFHTPRRSHKRRQGLIRGVARPVRAKQAPAVIPDWVTRGDSIGRGEKRRALKTGARQLPMRSR